MAHVHGAGWVGRYEFQQHLFTVAYIGLAKLLQIIKHLFHHSKAGFFVHKEVNKSRPGNIDFGNSLIGWQVFDDFLCQISGFHACRFGQHHGQVGGKVAVGLIFGAFHLNPPWRAIGNDFRANQVIEGGFQQIK